MGRWVTVGDVSEAARSVHDWRDFLPLGVAFCRLMVEEVGDSVTQQVSFG